MVGSEYSTEDYKFLIINIGIIMRKPEMLKYVTDHLKTKNVCKHAVKRLHLVKIYVLDQNKTQKTSEKAPLESFPDCFKNRKMRGKAVDNYPHVLEFACQCHKTQKTYNKVMDTYLSKMRYVPD